MATNGSCIGNKITLISKAEVRYVGILYDVNTKDSTLTLSKVSSYGTEDRKVPKALPARDEIYEYIKFRAHDIKDLKIDDPPNDDPLPDDPAIVSALKHPSPPFHSLPHSPPTRPPLSSLLGVPRLVPPVPRPQMMVIPGPLGPNYVPYTSGQGNFPSPFGGTYIKQPTVVLKPGPVIPSASSLPPALQIDRPGTTTSHMSLSPTKTSTPITTVSKNTSEINVFPILEESAVSSTDSSSNGVDTETTYAASSMVTQATAVSTQTPKPYVSLGSSALSQTETASSTGSQERVQVSHQSELLQKTKASSDKPNIRTSPGMESLTDHQSNRTFKAPKMKGNLVAVASTTSPTEHSPLPLHSGPGTSRSKGRQQRQHASGRRARTTREPESDGHSSLQEASQYPYRGPPRRGGYRDGPEGYYNQRQRGRSTKIYGTDSKGGDNGSDASKQPFFRYDSDFDFETANARFNRDQLEREMKYLNVDDAERSEFLPSLLTPGSRLVIDGKEWNEQQVVDEEARNDQAPVYKKDDFFDVISCDSLGANRRTNRRAERSLNTETFGTTSKGYRGRGRNQYNRGGYGRGYQNYHRGYQNYRYDYDQRRGGYPSRPTWDGRGRRSGRTDDSKGNTPQLKKEQQPEQKEEVKLEQPEQQKPWEQEPPKQQEREPPKQQEQKPPPKHQEREPPKHQEQHPPLLQSSTTAAAPEPSDPVTQKVNEH